MHGMELRPGRGGEVGAWGRVSEDDLLNVVWVVDSNVLPFNRAEVGLEWGRDVGEGRAHAPCGRG